MFLRDSNSKEQSLNQGNKLKKFFKDMNRIVSRSRIREGFDSGPDDNDNWYNYNVSALGTEVQTESETSGGSVAQKVQSFNETLREYAEKSKEYYGKQGVSSGKSAGIYKLNEKVEGKDVYYLVNDKQVVRKVPHYKKPTDNNGSTFWDPTNSDNASTNVPHISCKMNPGTTQITQQEIDGMTKGDDIGEHEPCYTQVDRVIVNADDAQSAYYITDAGKKRLLNTSLYTDTDKQNHSCAQKNKPDERGQEHPETIDKIPNDGNGEVENINFQCKSGAEGTAQEINQLNNDLKADINYIMQAVNGTQEYANDISNNNVNARSKLNTSHTNLVAEKKRLEDLQGNTLALKRSFEDSVKDANVLKIHYALWVFAFILTCVLIYLDYDSTYVLVAALAVIGTSFTVFIVQQVKKLKKKLSENLYKRKQVIDRTKDSSKKDEDDDSSLLGSGAKLSMKVMRNA